MTTSYVEYMNKTIFVTVKSLFQLQIISPKIIHHWTFALVTILLHVLHLRSSLTMLKFYDLPKGILESHHAETILKKLQKELMESRIS